MVGEDKQPETHKHIIINKMSFNCQYCPRVFHTTGDRNSHVSTHEYLCEQCEEKVFSRKDLDNHIKKTHSVEVYKDYKDYYTEGKKIINGASKVF